MDSLPDEKISSIWGRVKKYINVSNIRGEDIRELSKNIEREMKAAAEAEGKQGSIETLIKKGFPKRAAEVYDVRIEIPKAGKPIEKVIKPRRRIKPKKLPEKITGRPKGKIAIRTKKRTKIFAAKNIKVTRGRWRNRNAYWVFNTKAKRLVTWGIER